MPPIAELEEIRRNQILTAALSAIAVNGHAKVTMAKICEQAKLSKGGVAHYFSSKQKLLIVAFESFFDRIFDQSRDIMDRQPDPEDKILSFTWLVNPHHPDFGKGYPILVDFMSLAAHDNAYRRIYKRWVSRWIEQVMDALQQGRMQGRFLKCDPKAAARTISAIYQGFILRWYLAPGHYPEQWTVAALSETLRTLMKSYD